MFGDLSRPALGALLLLGLSLAFMLTHQAVAFPPGVCHGTSCTGSTSDYFGREMCMPGVTTWWEDSYIPAHVRNPRLAKFTLTPDPPCEGATVSAPVSDPWPASNTDPDGKPAAKKEPGKAIFRFRWTITVRQGAAYLGGKSIRVDWTLHWTAPANGSNAS